MKVTAYFEAMRSRPDQAMIQDGWIERTLKSPLRADTRVDGRGRFWAVVPEMDGRFLRVIVLPDGETVHNAFFDRGFKR